MIYFLLYKNKNFSQFLFHFKVKIKLYFNFLKSILIFSLIQNKKSKNF